ncbi:fluoride efflux transporter CrcB [Bacillus sp. 165]|uniref:fluoride efflux transporter CrcB n=1 Tax=Bacillus sp. 165 TaxID=1529117 RepID=UPI001ADBB0CC|nr:fluoride efflux transporter CrcB [Bacillus sp. 165]MBO9129781.1 fluoride efflux transporter CrcB [Bacillus sp. 165]
MNFIAVALGGFLGALSRFIISQTIPTDAGAFPLSTFLVNITGCFLLGWFFTKTNRKWHVPSYIRLGLGTGFTGSFTTFSTFSVESVRLMESDKTMIAVSYIASSILIGIGLSLLGARIAASSVKEEME